MQEKRASTWSSIAWRIVRGCIIVLGGALVIVTLIQDEILYHPEVVEYATVVQRARRHDLEVWAHESGGRDYHGLIAPELGGEQRGVVVIFHGNAGEATQRAHYIEPLAGLGYRVVLAEYPGFGARPGEASEEVLVEAGVEIVEAACARWPRGTCDILGESLGAGVAAGVAARMGEDVDGVVVVTPWDSLPSAARTRVPLPLWALKRLLRDRYDSAANLREYGGEVAVIIAQEDAVIPPAYAERLVSSLGERAAVWRLEGAGHTDWMVRFDRQEWGAVMGHLRKNKKGP